MLWYSMRKDALRLMETDVKRSSLREELPEWLMTGMGMVWLAAFPFWQNGSYSHITLSKWHGMLALTAATVLLAAVAAVMRLAMRRGLRFDWMQAAGLAYFALVALSARFGSWAEHAGTDGRLTVLWGAMRHEGLITQLCYGAVFLSMSVTRVKLRPLLHAASVGLLAYAAFTALQYAGFNPLGLFPEGRSVVTNYEFQGPIGNIDMVVGYVSIAMAAALGGFAWPVRAAAQAPGRRAKGPCWLWLLAGLSGALLLLCMEVQCGLIALGGLLVLLGLMSLRRPECRWRTMLILAGVLAMVSVRLMLGLPWLDGTEALCLRTEAWRLIPLGAGVLLCLAAPVLRRRTGGEMYLCEVAVIALGAAFLALVAVYTLPVPEGNALWELREMLHGRPQDGFGSERIGIWRLTLEMCGKNLLWGTGPDAFLHAMDQHLLETGQRLVQRFDNPHNLFLGVMANSGVPALGLYVALVLGAIVWAALRMGRDQELTPLMLGVLCYLVQGMFTFSICLVTPMFWAALGMLAGQMNERMT